MKNFEKIAKNLTSFVVFVLSLMLFLSCDDKKKDDPTPATNVNNTSITPANSFSRTNKKLGCLDISGRSVKISVWDNGSIDGDIVSVYVNGKKVIDEVTMDGPSNKYSVNVDLDYSGFNYILLYAHNVGTISPNTASMSINDGSGDKTFQISSDLSTNGYFDIVVGGSQSGVTCSGGGNNTGGGTSSTGRVVFWTAKDQQCGTISVSVNGLSGSITSFYSASTPTCGASGCATFTLPPGTYNWSASCSGGYTWGTYSTVTVTAGGCATMKLN
jgi:hypothetical protein